MGAKAIPNLPVTKKNRAPFPLCPFRPRRGPLYSRPDEEPSAQSRQTVLRLRAQDGQRGLAEDAAAHEQAGSQRQGRDGRQGRQDRP